jgi:hypothetical protein
MHQKKKNKKKKKNDKKLKNADLQN